jgi:uncharacterized repeat protein (TIGR03833 family)
VPPESALKHKPFAALRNVVTNASAPAPKPPAPSFADKPPLGRIIVREEFDATDANDAATITRVIGMPREHLSVLGKKWRELLGQTVAIEGRDLLVMADVCERIAGLLRDAGAGEVVIVRRPPETNLSEAGKRGEFGKSGERGERGEPGGTQRAQIRRGLRVAIVQKADQESGALTEGVVHDILTSSPNHPRGIKVRLDSGQVGRVRRILSR